MFEAGQGRPSPPIELAKEDEQAVDPDTVEVREIWISAATEGVSVELHHRFGVVAVDGERGDGCSWVSRHERQRRTPSTARIDTSREPTVQRDPDAGLREFLVARLPVW